MNNVLANTVKGTSSFVNGSSKADRKKYGQFFTAQSSAKFMASLFSIPAKDSIRILDAGAGSGILSVALVERLRNEGFSGAIRLVCYETDSSIIPLLKSNLDELASACNIEYELRAENYILSQPFSAAGLFDGEGEYDLVIGNPPYKKIPKDTKECRHMSDVCYGAPNLYFLFMSMGISNLKQEGELVYIIPRSWTSGAYFARFRQYLLSLCVITDIHLFESRDKVFDGESVLQETMIIKVKKSQRRPQRINVTYTATSDFSDIRSFSSDYDTIVRPNGYICLVTSPSEADTLQRINRFPSSLPLDGLPMKTGVIVDFRTKEVLRDEGNEANSYPLFYSHHIRDGKVQWPIGAENEFICTTHLGYLQENTYYLFVKRFTSKEENRRLQCGIYIPNDSYKYISTQNKVNYIRCSSAEEAYGLYVLLNSTLYDNYYRILNGSTQVNSTEVNSMPVPTRDVISRMGSELMGKDLSVSNCNEIINKWIK